MNIEIKEFKNGRFQVWRDNMVLRPEEFMWWNHYQASHEFMYFDNFDDTESAVEYIMNKENLVRTIVYEIKDNQKVY